LDIEELFSVRNELPVGPEGEEEATFLLVSGSISQIFDIWRVLSLKKQ